jgi:hypothetical protein
MAGEFAHSYVGKETFPLLSYMDEVKEQRTGQTKASNGLDADALQSSTKAAVAATLSAAQARTELLARMFAETAFRYLFKGLYQLVKENQTTSRTIRLKGKFVDIDPRPWDTDMDTRVVIALGAGLMEDRMALIAAVLAKQESIFQTLGPANPLVRLDQYYNALARSLELGGIRDVDSYFEPVTKEQGEAYRQQAMSQPKPPDPATMLAQVEIKKAETEMMVAREKLQLEALKAKMEHELRLREMQQEFFLKTQEMELKYQASVNEARLQQAIDGSKAAIDAMSKERQDERSAALELHRIERTAEVQREANTQKAAVQREAAHLKAEAAREKGEDAASE